MKSFLKKKLYTANIKEVVHKKLYITYIIMYSCVSLYILKERKKQSVFSLS